MTAPKGKELDSLLLPEIGPKATDIRKWQIEYIGTHPKKTKLSISLILPVIGPLGEKVKGWMKEGDAQTSSENATGKADANTAANTAANAVTDRKTQEANASAALSKMNDNLQNAVGPLNATAKQQGFMEKYEASTTQGQNASQGQSTSQNQNASQDQNASQNQNCKEKEDSKMGKLGKMSKDKMMKQQVKSYLEELLVFSNTVTTRHKRWITDIEAMVKNGDTHLGNANSEQNEENKKTQQAKMTYHIKRLLRGYASKSSINWSMMKQFYMKTHRRKMRVILNYIHSQENPDGFHKEAKDLFVKYTDTMKSSHDTLYKELMKGLDGFSGKYSSLDEDNRATVSKMIEGTFDKMNKQRQKINTLYELKYSILEMIIDSQFYVIYVIKALRILFAYVALFLTTRMFVPIYEDTVYDAKKDPPGLWKFMLIFLAFDVSLNVFLLVLLYLLKYLFKSDENSFVVDDLLIGSFMVDYVIGILIIMVLGILIGRVIMQKKYFKYKYEGVRAIRAFEKIIFFISIVIIILPLYMIY